jgi:diaminopimelate decarboxylase
MDGEKRWWKREDLFYLDRRLNFGGADVESLARSAGTPLYLYNGERIRQNIRRLRNALQSTGLRYKLFFAMKANHYPPLLTYLKTLGACGIDACSPQELLLARQCGFREDEISYTSVSVSDQDLQCLSRHPEVWVNCDSLSSIRRLGRLCPGRKIGIRINPNLGLGYQSNELLLYSGERTTKFGVYFDRFQEALDLAKRHRLQVTGLHFHTGCGYLTPQLSLWNDILAACRRFIDRVPQLERVNVGGGLGIPLTQDDEPLDLEAWSGILARQFAGGDLEIQVEPGDYLVKDAGVLVLEANTVETKNGTLFVGVNGGFNIHVEPAFYRLPLEPVPCRERNPGETEGNSALRNATVAGNINEALDIWYEDFPLPEIEEGEFLAFLNAGGYGSAMSSNHCLRGQFSEYLLL